MIYTGRVGWSFARRVLRVFARREAARGGNPREQRDRVVFALQAYEKQLKRDLEYYKAYLVHQLRYAIERDGSVRRLLVELAKTPVNPTSKSTLCAPQSAQQQMEVAE